MVSRTVVGLVGAVLTVIVAQGLLGNINEDSPIRIVWHNLKSFAAEEQ